MNKNLSFGILVPIVLLFTGCLSISSKKGVADYDSSFMNNAQITSDINLSGKAKGTGTRNELLGFIKWGDSGRSTYEGEYKDYLRGNKMVYTSKQSAVYNALDGKPDSFLLDPQFRTVERDFFIFKRARTEVVGQKASKSNYRQIKRFNTDTTETLPLDELPHSFTVKRKGQESIEVVASRGIPEHVTESIHVYDTSPLSGQPNVPSIQSNFPSEILSSLRSLEARILENKRKMSDINAKINSLSN
jgi:hypothetical protein